MKNKQYQKQFGVFRVPIKSHKKIVAHCEKHGNKLYVWIEKTLLKAIEQENERERERESRQAREIEL